MVILVSPGASETPQFGLKMALPLDYGVETWKEVVELTSPLLSDDIDYHFPFHPIPTHLPSQLVMRTIDTPS